MVLTVTYSVELSKEDVEKIRKQLNTKPSLTPYLTMQGYLGDRLKGIVILELQQDYGENLSIKCKQRSFEIHIY